MESSGKIEMPQYRYLELLDRGPVSRVQLKEEGSAYHAREVRALVAELNSVAEATDCRTLYIDCLNVKVLSSEMLSSLILLERKLQQKEGKLILCGVRAEVREVLSWTKLDQVFEIQEGAEGEAATFA